MKNLKGKVFVSTVLLIAIILIIPADIWAQCPMCRMSAESNLANGGTAGNGLNAGILYMLATPYLLVGIVGYIWYKNRRKDDEVMTEEV
ncbi:MAG: hypothetical protein R2879_21065 [Saprospiraceae bacterium]